MISLEEVKEHITVHYVKDGEGERLVALYNPTLIAAVWDADINGISDGIATVHSINPKTLKSHEWLRKSEDGCMEQILDMACPRFGELLPQAMTQLTHKFALWLQSTDDE